MQLPAQGQGSKPVGRICMLPSFLPEREEFHAGSSPRSTSPRTAELELQLRQFEPWRVSVESKPVRVGERIKPGAGEKQRGLRPWHLPLLKKSKFDMGWISHLELPAFEVE